MTSDEIETWIEIQSKQIKVLRRNAEYYEAISVAYTNDPNATKLAYTETEVGSLYKYTTSVLADMAIYEDRLSKNPSRDGYPKEVLAIYDIVLVQYRNTVAAMKIYIVPIHNQLTLMGEKI